MICHFGTKIGPTRTMRVIDQNKVVFDGTVEVWVDGIDSKSVVFKHKDTYYWFASKIYRLSPYKDLKITHFYHRSHPILITKEFVYVLDPNMGFVHMQSKCTIDGVTFPIRPCGMTPCEFPKN